MQLRVAGGALCAVILGSAAMAEPAQGGFHVTGYIGGLITDDLHSSTTTGVPIVTSFNPGPYIAMATGYSFANGFRLDADFAYTQISRDQAKQGGLTVSQTGDIDIYYLTLGLFYDWQLAPSWTLSFGGGAGAAHTEFGRGTASANGVTVTGGGGSETDLTAFGEVGITLALTDRVDLISAYRFQTIDIEGRSTDMLTQHVVRFGLRYYF